MPIAIEVFDLDAQDASVRIKINGILWAVVARTQLAEIGRAYALAEDPAAAASTGLANLGDGRPVTAAAVAPVNRP